MIARQIEESERMLMRPKTDYERRISMTKVAIEGFGKPAITRRMCMNPTQAQAQIDLPTGRLDVCLARDSLK